MKKLLLLTLAFFVTSGILYAETKIPTSREATTKIALNEFGLLAVQAQGRVKPLDTLAREGIALLTGKEYFQKFSAIEMLASLVFESKNWDEVPFIAIEQHALKKDLGFDVQEKYFSPVMISHNPRIMTLFNELDRKQKLKEKLDSYYRAVQRLANQLSFLHDLITGQALRLVPPSGAGANVEKAWLSLSELNEEQKLRFMLIAATYVNPDTNIQSHMEEHVRMFAKMASNNNPNLYPARNILEREVRFHRLHPFRLAWIIALFAILIFIISLFSTKKVFYWAGIFTYFCVLALQIYGFASRMMIAGRPPVSNMYESIIWVAFGCMLFGIIFELIYKKRAIALAALIFAVIALIIADNVSTILDANIHPLEPVLRSNLWLTIHVLTITLGYAAFALSLIIGDIGIAPYVFLGKEAKSLPIKQLALYAYRAVQVGVILLAAGTILGGVWADYSWGRFWGWDPKETWALIALLGYLALLHARFSGMVRPFGFLVGCIVAFLGVLMAWYGVNFVLGVGLHSYGFSSGGFSYVFTYVVAQLCFVIFAGYLYKKDYGGKR